MAQHTVNATITVEISNGSALGALGAAGMDERAAVQAAAEAGLKELPDIARRYGFSIVESSVSVTD